MNLSLGAEEVGIGQDSPPGFYVDKERYELRPGRNDFEDFVVMGWSPTRINSNNYDGISAKFHAQPAPEWLAMIGGTEGERYGAWGPDYFDREVFDLGGYDNPLTGMKGAGVRYTPKHEGLTPLNGSSFIEISPANGLGLYSHTGPAPLTGMPAFLQPKRYSSNAEDCGLYLATPVVKGDMRPFKSDMKTVVIKSRQEVAHAVFPGESRGIQKGGACLFHNTNDPRAPGDPVAKVSRIALSPNVFNSILGKDSPKIQFDPDQSGHPFIGGGFVGGGHESFLTSSYMTNSVWTTYGSGTMHETFSIRNFTMTMTWNQFKNTLRHVTYKAGLDGGSYNDVALIFGEGWDNHKNWQLKTVKCGGQEIHNADYETVTASMGGRVKWVTYQAI